MTTLQIEFSYIPTNNNHSYTYKNLTWYTFWNDAELSEHKKRM